MYKLLRKLLFCFDPEVAHHLTMSALKWVPGCCFKSLRTNPVNVIGLHFENPIGLAAGLDKNGDYIDALAKLGFGFIEVGTVTPRPQPGNPKPRLFRLTKYNAVINRMGFNNKGVDHLLKNVQKRKYQGILGINIGKNFDTPIEKAVDDYLICLRKVYAYADYITVNISSPNTQQLRDLQYGQQLTNLLRTLKAEQAKLHQETDRYVPMLVKIAPDLNAEEVKQIANTLLAENIDAVIAVNTALARPGIDADSDEKGGLSGEPICPQSTKVIQQLHQVLGDKMPIIGVGGIHDKASANEKFQAGAKLIQVYTGLIYQGPGFLSSL